MRYWGNGLRAQRVLLAARMPNKSLYLIYNIKKIKKNKDRNERSRALLRQGLEEKHIMHAAP